MSFRPQDQLIYRDIGRSVPAPGYQEFLRGNLPAKAGIGTSSRFAASHSAYLWLNRLQCWEPANTLPPPIARDTKYTQSVEQTLKEITMGITTTKPPFRKGWMFVF